MNDTIYLHVYSQEFSRNCTQNSTVDDFMFRDYFYMQVAFYKVPQYGFTVVIIWYFQSQKYLNHKIL